MPKYDLDLDSIQSFSGGNFPIGKHRAKLAEVEERNSDSSGNPTLYWEWEGADDESMGETIRSFSSLQDHALGSLKMHAEAFGYHGNTTLDTDACIGQYAILVVGMRKRRGRDNGDEDDRPTVIAVMPDDQAGGRANGPAASGGVRRVGGSSRPAAAPARPSGNRRVGRSEDDELPF